ncbi:hypothetical protein LCGC14_2672710, partial [marine sediment metagenome]
MESGRGVRIGVYIRMIIAIIQARLASTRLPNKVLMEVVPGISMLEMVIRRVRLAIQTRRIIIVTPDIKIAYMSEYYNCACEVWHKSPNVLSEYLGAINRFHSMKYKDTIVGIVRI